MRKVRDIRTTLLPNRIKERIIVLAGEFKKPSEILKLIKEENKGKKLLEEKRLTKKIENILARHKEYVCTLKEQYAKSIMEIPIAHKKVRLERLENLYDEAKTTSERRELLKSAREELEGVRVNLNMYQLNFFGGMSDAELEQREREIISRVQSLAAGEGAKEETQSVSVLPASSEAEVVSPV